MEKELLVLDQVPLKEAKKSSDGTFDVCCITPGWGSSGFYSEEVLKEDGVKALTQGLHMYWDHPTTIEEETRPERSLHDLAGVLTESARWEDNGWNGPGIYARSKVFSPYDAKISELAPHIGLSLVAYGSKKFGEAGGEKGDIVESITAARSVDFVTLPGRGGKIQTLFESLRSEPTKPEKVKETEKLKEGEKVDEAEAARLREASTTLTNEVTQLKESNKTLLTERDALKSENQKLKESLVLKEAREKATAAISKVDGIPELTQARIVEAVASKAPVREDGTLDSEKFNALIEESVKAEAKYLESLGFGSVQGLGGGDGVGGSTPPEDESKLTERLTGAFSSFGLSESASKLAANGR